MHITEICIFSCISTINMCVCVITSPDDSIYDRGASTPVSGITVLLYHYTLFWSSVWSQDCMLVSVQGMHTTNGTSTLSEGSEDIIIP
jgi:hypothetical protein